ncbi:MAG: polysaccharide deacetylase family protein [Candidatus Cryosericum sp.]
MKRSVTVLAVILVVAVVSLTGCRSSLPPSSTATESYPYRSQTPRTKPVFKVPATVSAGVDANLMVPILMYHEVASHTPGMDAEKLSLLVTPEQFAGQMQYLMDHDFTTITLDDWMAARAGRATLPRNPVVLTFDDGRLGVYRNAFPVLKRNGQKAILFLISGEVGRVVKGYLDWPMVREMQSSGLITMGSHTVHHVELSLLSPQRTLMELSYSKMVIQRNTGRRCDYFCYPYGKYTAWVANLVGAVGYRAATTEIPGWSRVTDNVYELRRVRIDGRDSMAVFAAKLSSGH